MISEHAFFRGRLIIKKKLRTNRARRIGKKKLLETFNGFYVKLKKKIKFIEFTEQK